MIRVVGSGNEKERRITALASNLSLTETELAALREFIDQRKIAIKPIRLDEKGAIVDRSDCVFADPELTGGVCVLRGHSHRIAGVSDENRL